MLVWQTEAHIKFFLKVLAHCAEGRKLAKAERPNLIDRFTGAKVRDCACAFQISLDFAKAFGSLDRSCIFAALSAEIETHCGIRQGCPIAPTVWIAFVHMILVELSRMFSTDWVCQHLIVFAGDTHMGWTFHE